MKQPLSEDQNKVTPIQQTDKIIKSPKLLKFCIFSRRVNQLVPIMEGENMAPTHRPPLVGWSDIHLSNYHLSIRDQFTITTYYLVLRITCLTSNQQNVGLVSLQARRPSWRGINQGLIYGFSFSRSATSHSSQHHST